MTIIFSKRTDTLFLQNIWCGLENIHLIEIEGHEDKDRIIPALLDETECLLLCGHGTPSGLIFPDLTGCIISDIEADYLRGKTIIGIWCHAAEFADYNNLRGFFTSMFISDSSEAKGFCYEATSDDIEAANIRFANRLNGLLKSDVPIYDWESIISMYRKEIPKESFEYFNYCGMVNHISTHSF